VAGAAARGLSGLSKVHHTIILFICIAILIASLLSYLSGTGLCLFGFKLPIHCFLYRTFGIKCALCGLSRSFCCLAHGDLFQALQFHVLGPAIFLFICLQIPYRIRAIIIQPKKMNKKLIQIGWLLTAILLTAIFTNWLIYLGGLIL
jgi:hypothetical protein